MDHNDAKIVYQGRKILLAEDNLINQKVAQMMLTSLGMVVELANNGREALDKILSSSLKGSQVHCVLMDMAMPVMGGVEATIVSFLLLLYFCIALCSAPGR